MTKQEIDILIIDYLTNRIRKDDYQKLMELIAESKSDPELYAIMKCIWETEPVIQSSADHQADPMFRKIVADARFSAAPVSDGSLKINTKSRFKLWHKVSAAAALIIMLSASVLFFLQKDVTGWSNLVENQFAPGGNKAVLTLGNGKRIILTDLRPGAIVQQDGIKITKTTDGQLVYEAASSSVNAGYNTITTPKGGQYNIILPDGTKVWLNASSALKYPANFKAFNKREVSLKGEGYFEVAHNPAKPFVVNSSNQRSTVLGTHFNIRSYEDDPQVVTTLIEGSIEVWSAVGMEGRIIKPGQESIIDKSGLSVGVANTEAVLAWKNGYFIFNNEELGSIMRKIERWYDVEVVFSKGMEKRILEGSTPRSKDLSEILRKFELTGNIHFKIEGRRITVMP